MLCSNDAHQRRAACILQPVVTPSWDTAQDCCALCNPVHMHGIPDVQTHTLTHDLDCERSTFKLSVLCNAAVARFLFTVAGAEMPFDRLPACKHSFTCSRACRTCAIR